MEIDPEVISTRSRGSSGCLCTKQKGWSSMIHSMGEGSEDITRARDVALQVMCIIT